MNAHPSRMIDAFSGLQVLVVGEAMLDSYLEGTSGRLCREAPVPIVSVTSRRDAPGGAANTAVNVRAMGARVSFVSVIGNDTEGILVRRALELRGVSIESILVSPDRATLAKQRVIASSQLLVRYDQGSTGPVGPDDEQWLIARLAGLYPDCDAVIISDYGYGILTPRVIEVLGDLQARHPRVMVADSKHLAAYKRTRLTAVKPNYDEAIRLLGSPGTSETRGRVDLIASAGDGILEVTGAKIAAVTLDTEGALVFERGRPPFRTFAQPTAHSRAAGAGDTFLAGLALALAAGAETPAAAEIASAAAAVVVAQDGTVACSADELRTRLAAEAKPALDLDELLPKLAEARRQGRRIVFTNGCFDILHRGHITYLGRAKALGDLLVVGVNSDESIRRLKGPSRPINGLEDRVEVLAALSCVDHIVTFDDDTPCELIRAVRPDVFVKGGDYTRERLPEADIVEEQGGIVKILPFVNDRSTTDIIEKIRRAYTTEVDGIVAWPGSLRLAAGGAGSANGHGAKGVGA